MAVIGRWPLLGGGRYSEVYYNMGKRFGLKVSGRYSEVAAIRRWPHLEVRLYMYMYIAYVPMGSLFGFHRINRGSNRGSNRAIKFNNGYYYSKVHSLKPNVSSS